MIYFFFEIFFLRFISKFDSILKYRNREIIAGHRGEYKSKILIKFFFRVIKAFNKFFKCRHKTFSKVTILKYNPSSIFDSIFNASFSNRSLSLPKRNNINIRNLHLFRKSNKPILRVSSLRKNKYKWCLIVSISKYFIHRRDCGFSEFFANRIFNKDIHGKNGFFLSYSLH